MLWNEIDYESQMKVIHRIYEVIVKEEDPQVRKHLVAAAYELEMWSNNPVNVTVEEVEMSDEEYIAYVQEGYLEPTSNSILSLIFGKKQ